MQNFVEIQQKNLELLNSDGFSLPPPKLNRGMELPRLDKAK